MTSKIRSTRLELPLAALTLGALASLFGSGCSTPAEAASPPAEAAPITVDAVVAEARGIPRTLTLTGSLVANRQADVAADAGGKVVATFAERGDLVEAGAVLARLDSRAAALSQAEASASAAAMIAQDQNAKLECERATRLFAANAISRAEFERTSTSCSTSTHSAQAAQARAGLAAKMLGDAQIRAPFRGVVAERRVTLGDYLSAGQTLLTLVDASTLRLEIAVPETAISQVSAGRPVSFQVASYPDRDFSGRVARLSPNLRPASRDQIVEVAVDNADGTLRPGMFATARLAIGEDRLPVVPGSAVVGQAPSERVFVISRERRVEERVVATGARKGAEIAITKGVNAGESVIARPNAEVRDGVRVK